MSSEISLSREFEKITVQCVEPQVAWSKVSTVAVHLAMGVLLFVRARVTDLTSSKAIYKCYM